MNETCDHTSLPTHNEDGQMPHPKKSDSRAFFVFSWVFVFAMLAFIFFMSARSGEALDTASGIITIVRNWLLAASNALFGHPVDVSPVGHFTEFFLLGIALTNALRLRLPLARSAAYATLIASLYGVSDELHQIFVPGRSCDPMDWLVDTLAALIASIVFTALLHMHQKRKNSRVCSNNNSL